MKSLVIVAAAALCCTAFAEGPEGSGPREGVRHGGPRGGGMPMMMDPIVRIATNPQMSEKLGLSDEQKAKLKELKTNSRNSETQKKVREATQRQAELLKADKIDEATVMKTIDEVFELRKEMAKEQVRRVIAVKSLLTPEQIAKAREAVKNMSGPHDERGPRRSPSRKGKGPRKGGDQPAPKPDGE